jgi:predicted ATPase
MTARGFARTAEPGAADGIEELRQGLEGHRASGFQLIVPRGLNWLAEAYGRCGEIPLGLGAVTEAIALASKAGGRLWEAESYRIEGELLLRCPGREAQGEACLQRALALAQKQGARSMELRAALGLARWWRAHGKTSEAGALLSPIYKWFAEGFETKDLRNARHLLEELGPDIGRRGRAA